MAFARRQLNATILPDGQVLVTGGTSGPGFNDTTAPVFAAEMWNPATENWTTMASAQIPRLYHSTALLLPDGRILSMGGNGFPQTEIYEPPYLFKGTRPAINSAPATVNYGQTFFVQTPDAAGVTQVTWIRLSSVTHAFNMDQRFSRLNFSQGAGGLNVVAPLNPNLAPPGHYMLFILNSNGVPSVAKIIQVTSNPGLPTVTVAATDANAAEAATPNTGTFTVSRTGSTAAALTVNYTVGGTASDGTDYTTIPTSVVIPAGSASATITVTPIDDTVSESNETVVVTLSSSASYNVGSPSAATVTIADNDVASAASIALSFNGQIRDRVGEGETALSADGQMDGTFTVTLSAGSGNRTVTRLDLARAGEGNWDTQPNNGFWVLGAASTLDAALFNAANGTVNFPLTAGSSFNIFARTQGALFVAGSSFTLTASFADGSTATATASIGAGGLPTVTVAATDANAAEAATPNTGTFTVSRTGSTAAALPVNYTVGGTASGGTDYTTIPTSVVIPAGSTSATITVTPIDDTVSEGNETVVVTLSSSASYNVGSPSAATVTIADNDVAPPASIALSFNGQIRDRVGEGETALSADGQMDGTFTVTLSAGSGNRTVTRLDLARAGQGNWDTQPNNGFWVLGAASTLDAALFNAANGTVNFPLTAGSSFNIFASDFQGAMFVAGSSFTLTASFADGSTATANVGIP